MLLLLLLASHGTAQAQEITGTVVDDGTDAPVAGANISVLRSTTTGSAADSTAVSTVLSDRAGRFRLSLPTSGEYTLHAERIGYGRVTSAPVAVRPGETVEVELRLSTKAVPLDPVTVTARYPPSPYSARLARLGHYERRETYGPEGSGFGRFISTEEIERRSAFYVTDYLAMVPGVIVRGGGGRRPPAVYMRSVTGMGGGYCRPTYYINRTRITTAEIDQFVSARDIAAIEIYPGYTGPVEFTGQSACGVIVILTK